MGVPVPLVIVAAAAVGLLTYEGIALASQRPTISELCWDWQAEHPFWAKVVAFLIGVLLGHLWR